MRVRRAFGSAVRGPLLSSHTPLSSHRLTSDVRTALYTLYSTLPPADLSLTITPSLDAYSTPHTCHERGLDLSWEAMNESRCRYFLLDAYTVIYLYRRSIGTADGEDDVIWPPERSSMLWKDANSLKQQRMRTARVVVCTGGTPDGDSFESYIEVVDEPPQGRTDPRAPEIVVSTGGGASQSAEKKFSFQQFLVFLRDEVTAAAAEAVS